jgi:hypothetical protein
LTLSISTTCAVPSALRSLTARLPTEVGSKCQGVLTAGNRARSGLLEVFERRVYLEGLREMLGALSTHLVVAEAANEVENGPSGAIDTREERVQRRT